jgi:divalent metal cation (Fe/Co/Zn/Cd) transporter
VLDIGRVQARWVGRSLHASLTVAVDGNVSVADAHGIGEAVHHHIIHDLPGVAQVDVHVDPWKAHAQDAHRATAAHPQLPPDDHPHHH